MIVFTSAAVSASGLAGDVAAMNGKNLGLTSPAIPPTTDGTNSELGGISPGKKMMLGVPGKLPNGIVGGAGGLATFEYGSRMPSTRILSARINVGDSYPRTPGAAISSSNGLS